MLENLGTHGQRGKLRLWKPLVGRCFFKQVALEELDS